MPEAEVLERETAVAEPKADASPDKGESKAEVEGNVSDLAKELKGMSADEARAFIENLPEEIRDDVLGEAERRGEQRARTRKQETESADQARSAAYDEIAKAGLAADQGLGRIFDAVAKHKENFDFEAAAQLLDKAKLAQLVVAYGNGQVAAVGKENDAQLQRIEKQYESQLQDLTPAEQKKMDDARWKDARQGSLDRVAVLIELLIARVDATAEERGVAKGKTSVKPELLKQIRNGRELANQLPRRVKSGPAAPPPDERARLNSELAELRTKLHTPEGREEFERKTPELRRRLKALEGAGK